MDRGPTTEDVYAAADRIADVIHRTPVLTCSALNRRCNAELFFKCENFQRVGAFKFRGAANAVLALGSEVRAVTTHSSGNHAAALALAASLRRLPAWVVMPRTAPTVKCRAVAEYGGQIEYCEPTLAAREEGVRRVMARTAATLIHPYNDPQIIAGQGTAALELCREVAGLDAIVAPVGGGGLLGGTALAVQGESPGTAVWGAEPRGADDAFRSLRAGSIQPSLNPRTMADGLLTSLGELTFPLLRKYATDIVTVSEESILSALRAIWQRMKLVVEPSAAVPLAALLESPECFRGQRVGLILSGGNLDLPPDWPVRLSS